MDADEFIQEDTYESFYFNAKGEVGESLETKTVCYRTNNVEKGSSAFFIKVYNGSLFDPFGMDANKINTEGIKFKKVKVEVFNLYHKYLIRRISGDFYKAQSVFNNA